MAGNLPFTPVSASVPLAAAPTPAPGPSPRPALGAVGVVTVSVPSISYVDNASGCVAPTIVGGVATGQFVGSGLGPQYIAQKFLTPATICNAVLQSSPPALCQFNITGLPAGNGLISGTASPANAALTTCNVTYSGTLPTTSISIADFPLTLVYVTPASVSFSGAPGSTVALQAPLVFNRSAAATVGTFVATRTVQTGVGQCTAQYTLPLANAFPPTCTATPSALNVAIQVEDADLTAPSVTVQVGSSNGDTETFTLPQLSRGVYRSTQLAIARGGVTVLPDNGRIDISNSNTSPIVLSIKYTDTLSPAGANLVRQTTLQLLPYKIR